MTGTARTIIVVGWLLLWLAPLCAQNSPAPEAPDSLKTYLLETVRVIAETPEESIGALQVLEFTGTREASTLNLYEGLQGIAGITNTAGTKGESNLRLRGFRKNEVKVLVDGRPLNAGYFGNVDLHQLAPSGIREIRIVKGPGSALYGSGAMGGVVNIITADPDPETWLRLDLLAKRNNANRFALSSSHQLGDLSYWFSLARENNNGIVLSRDFTPTPSEGGGVRDHSSKTQYDIHSRFGYSPSEFSQTGLSAGISVIPERLIASSVYAVEYRMYEDWARYWATLEHEAILSGSLRLSGHLYYDGGRDTYLLYRDAAHTNLQTRSKMIYSTLGLDPRLDWSPGASTKVSAGLRAERLHSTRRDNVAYLEWTPHWLDVISLWSQASREFSPIFSVSASLGFSGSLTDGNASPKVFPEPSIGFFFKLLPGGESSLSLGRNSSFPTLRQLFSAESGNTSLKPQHALKAEVEHRQELRLGSRPLSARLNLFYNDARDLIERRDDIFQNIRRVQSWGMECSLLASPLAWWNAELGYGNLFWKGEDGYRLTETPRNQLWLSQSLKLPWSLQFSHRVGYTDNRLSESDIGGYAILPPYWVHDVSLARDFSRFKLNLGVENVFDRYYETECGFPAAGINFFVSLSAGI